MKSPSLPLPYDNQKVDSSDSALQDLAYTASKSPDGAGMAAPQPGYIVTTRDDPYGQTRGTEPMRSDYRPPMPPVPANQMNGTPDPKMSD
jgi:hypothetical protein